MLAGGDSVMNDIVVGRCFRLRCSSRADFWLRIARAGPVPEDWTTVLIPDARTVRAAGPVGARGVRVALRARAGGRIGQGAACRARTLPACSRRLSPRSSSTARGEQLIIAWGTRAMENGHLVPGHQGSTSKKLAQSAGRNAAAELKRLRGDAGREALPGDRAAGAARRGAGFRHRAVRSIRIAVTG